MKLLLPFIGGAFSATIPLGTAPLQPINSNFMNPNFRPIQNFINPRPVQIVEPVQTFVAPQPVLQSPNMFGGMDPMMMMMLMSDDDSSMKDLLPLMMMQGGAGGMFGGGQNGMNPLLMMTLLDEDDACEVNSEVKKLTQFTAVQQKSVARGDVFVTGDSDAADIVWGDDTEDLADAEADTAISGAVADEMVKYIDYEFISCEKKLDSSSFSDLLPLMMMGQNNMQTMDPMMLMMLVDDDSNGLSLPMLMSMQGMNSGTQANPLLWLSLLDDSTLTKTQCDAKYALPYIFEWGAGAGTGMFVISKVTANIRDLAADDEQTSFKFLNDYAKCINAATKEGGNKFEDLLPLMMMNGGGFGGQSNGQMDPMLMMTLMDSDSDSSLLPFLMLQQGGMGGMNGGQMDPMMMMLLLKD